MDFGVVLLEYGTRDTIEAFLRPIDLKGARNAIHKSLFPLHDLEWASDTARGEKDGMCTAEGGIGVRQSFPIGEGSGTRHAQRIECSSANGDCVCGALFVESQTARDRSPDCIRALRRVIEPPGAHGCDIT